MQKKLLFNLFIATFFVLVLSSCEEEKNIPIPDFSANEYSSTNNEINIAFTDFSTGDAQEWIWRFEGGTPSVSYERDPIVSYTSGGTFDVTLTVRNGDGSQQITRHDYINVGDFLNPTWADIYITHNSQDKVVAVDETILLASIGSPVISYYAETSGLTAQGEQVGLLIYWEEEINMLDGTLWDFIIDDFYVFINVQNEGPDNFYPFTVNWGDPDYEIVDYITIPNDGLWKSTGYYDAWDNMVIVADFENIAGDVSWTEGIHFDLLWVVNQGLDIWYDGTKSSLKSKVKSKDLRRNGAKSLKQSGVKR